MPELTMLFPSPLPLHANQRLHFAQKAERVTQVREQARRTAGRGPGNLPSPCRLIVKIGWPTRSRRDAMNAHPTVKAAIDGIVLAGGWLKDDDDKHLQGPDLRPYYLGRKGCVEMTFCFVPVEPDLQQLIHDTAGHSQACSCDTCAQIEADL